MKILYVDDEPINLQLFKINLGKKHEVYTASNAHEGLKILETNASKIDVVVSDFRMPRMNGIEFIECAKNQHPSVNYYILTGFIMSSEIEKALNKGTINKCFKKPFNVVEIEYEMNSLMGKA